MTKGLAVGVALTVLNLVVFAANLSITARAEVGGKDRRGLYTDRDFRHAVEDIVESCRADGPKIKC